MSCKKESRNISVVAKLLKDELAGVRFAVEWLKEGQITLISDGMGGHITTTLEVDSQKELDAHELKIMHEQGKWKTGLMGSQIRVRIKDHDHKSRSRRNDLEAILDGYGVLCEGHVGHVLGDVLKGYHRSKGVSDRPHMSVGVCDLAELWRYLVIDACLLTPKKTAKKLSNWARGAKVEFETRVLLGGIKTQENIALRNGIRVEKLAEKRSELENRLPISSGIGLSEYLGRTLLRIPCTIGPGLWKPKKVTQKIGDLPATSWEVPIDISSEWALEKGTIQELCQAISVICDVKVEAPVIWSDFGEQAHFGERHSITRAGTGESIGWSKGESEMTREELQKAMRFFRNMGGRRAEDEIQVAIRHWIRSKSHKLPIVEKLIHLRITLEALYLDKSDSGEYGFRLAIRGAWYAGRNQEDRQKCYKALKKAYNVTSGAVHTGRVKKEAHAKKVLEESQEICRKAIMKRMGSKKNPVWNEIIL